MVGLVEELGYPATEREVSARLARVLSEPAQAVFVAEARGEIRGWVHVQEFLSLASEPAGLIAGLVVDARVRRAGVGRGLVAVAEGWARARGLTSMRLRSRVTRGGAHAFYERLGYAVAKRQLQFRKELSPASGVRAVAASGRARRSERGAGQRARTSDSRGSPLRASASSASASQRLPSPR
jgi:GNAT superfamily N-acetyltransferase